MHNYYVWKEIYIRTAGKVRMPPPNNFQSDFNNQILKTLPILEKWVTLFDSATPSSHKVQPLLICIEI